ncbi:MAG: hypothetical protein R3B54_05790 [Bdellovibrionota bacterium]
MEQVGVQTGSVLESLSPSGDKLKSFQRFVLPGLAVIAVMVLFHVLSDGTFLTSRNLSNLSRQICTNLTLATGMTLVIITAGIDLSVGSVLALCGMVAAITQVQFGFSTMGATGALLSTGIALVVGGFTGAFTGFAVSRLKITPFIVTLGMMVICRGLTLIISGAQAVSPIGDSFGALSSEYLPVGYSGLLFAVVAAGAVLVHWRTPSERRSLQNTVLICLLAGVGAMVFCGYRGILHRFSGA